MTSSLLMRGTDERTYFVLEEFDGCPVDPGFRIEIARDRNFLLSHADSVHISNAVHGLGGFKCCSFA